MPLILEPINLAAYQIRIGRDVVELGDRSAVSVKGWMKYCRNRGTWFRLSKPGTPSGLATVDTQSAKIRIPYGNETIEITAHEPDVEYPDGRAEFNVILNSQPTPDANGDYWQVLDFEVSGFNLERVLGLDEEYNQARCTEDWGEDYPGTFTITPTEIRAADGTVVRSRGEALVHSLSGKAVQPNLDKSVLGKHPTNGGDISYTRVSRDHLDLPRRMLVDARGRTARIEDVVVDGSQIKFKLPKAFIEAGSTRYPIQHTTGTDPAYTQEMDSFVSTVLSGDGVWSDIRLLTTGSSVVYEIILSNATTGTENTLGVRKNGSSLNRYVNLHEAEGGGQTHCRMFVETDSMGWIEAYHSDISDGDYFYKVGYWSNVSFTELFETAHSGFSDTAWKDATNLPSGGASCIHQVIVYASGESARWGGVRANGSSLDRRLFIHEAESGGYTYLDWLVKADSSKIIEIYENPLQPIYQYTGYFGSELDFVENWQSLGVSDVNSWIDKDLSLYLDEAGRMCDFLVASSHESKTALFGVRDGDDDATERSLTEHEAESAGSGGEYTGFGISAKSNASGIVHRKSYIDGLSAAYMVFYLTGYFKPSAGGTTYTEYPKARASVLAKVTPGSTLTLFLKSKPTVAVKVVPGGTRTFYPKANATTLAKVSIFKTYTLLPLAKATPTASVYPALNYKLYPRVGVTVTVRPWAPWVWLPWSDVFSSYAEGSDGAPTWISENYGTSPIQQIESGEFSFTGATAADEPISKLAGFSYLDYQVQVDIKCKENLRGLAIVSPRFKDVNDKYEIAVDFEFTSISLNKVVGGVWSSITSVFMPELSPMVLEQWYTLKVDVLTEGATTRIKAWVDDHLYINETDSDLTYRGVAILTYDADNTYHIHFDNFAVRRVPIYALARGAALSKAIVAGLSIFYPRANAVALTKEQVGLTLTLAPKARSVVAARLLFAQALALLPKAKVTAHTKSLAGVTYVILPRTNSTAYTRVLNYRIAVLTAGASATAYAKALFGQMLTLTSRAQAAVYGRELVASTMTLTPKASAVNFARVISASIFILAPRSESLAYARTVKTVTVTLQPVTNAMAYAKILPLMQILYPIANAVASSRAIVQITTVAYPQAKITASVKPNITTIYTLYPPTKATIHARGIRQLTYVIMPQTLAQAKSFPIMLSTFSITPAVRMIATARFALNWNASITAHTNATSYAICRVAYLIYARANALAAAKVKPAWTANVVPEAKVAAQSLSLLWQSISLIPRANITAYNRSTQILAAGVYPRAMATTLAKPLLASTLTLTAKARGVAHTRPYVQCIYTLLPRADVVVSSGSISGLLYLIIPTAKALAMAKVSMPMSFVLMPACLVAAMAATHSDILGEIYSKRAVDALSLAKHAKFRI